MYGVEGQKKQIHRQQGDLIHILFFSTQNKESRIMRKQEIWYENMGNIP
jgi:hypothetical protein